MLITHIVQAAGIALAVGLLAATIWEALPPRRPTVGSRKRR